MTVVTIAIVTTGWVVVLAGWAFARLRRHRAFVVPADASDLLRHWLAELEAEAALDRASLRSWNERSATSRLRLAHKVAKAPESWPELEAALRSNDRWNSTWSSASLLARRQAAVNEGIAGWAWTRWPGLRSMKTKAMLRRMQHDQRTRRRRPRGHLAEADELMVP